MDYLAGLQTDKDVKIENILKLEVGIPKDTQDDGYTLLLRVGVHFSEVMDAIESHVVNKSKNIMKFTSLNLSNIVGKNLKKATEE